MSDNLPIATPSGNWRAIEIDGVRKVAASMSDDGDYCFIFYNNGNETRIALSSEALACAVHLANTLKQRKENGSKE